eukprot:gnl/TRDRNA2_/TRDRNA2_125907_c0_seq1.p1 gnl/TRDRNA2_/TRDRNA2_125907_c0~~gnl/TRDRNA2_/TRDRNA2_125907_c0_seq1.p1  ORF type:complete len:336 (-),score=62.32 gnl/TRDRNA2_/TRDRNA2_125907_c0_seq1:121-1128(-)
MLLVSDYKDWRRELEDSSRRMEQRAEALAELKESCDQMERLRQQRMDSQKTAEQHTRAVAEKTEKRSKQAAAHASWRAKTVLGNDSNAAGSQFCALPEDGWFGSFEDFKESGSFGASKPPAKFHLSKQLEIAQGAQAPQIPRRTSLRRALLGESRRQSLERQTVAVDGKPIVLADSVFVDDHTPEKNVLAPDFYDETPGVELPTTRFREYRRRSHEILLQPGVLRKSSKEKLVQDVHATFPTKSFKESPRKSSKEKLSSCHQKVPCDMPKLPDIPGCKAAESSPSSKASASTTASTSRTASQDATENLGKTKTAALPDHVQIRRLSHGVTNRLVS